MENPHRDGSLDRRVLSNIRFNARRLARNRTIPGMEAEDYEQDLVFDLWRRSEAFNPDRATFRTFADRVVRNRICNLASPTLRLAAERSMHSLDAVIPDEEGEERPLVDRLPDRELPLDEIAAIRLDVGRFVAGLEQPLLQCCEILLDDSVADGARAAGIHRSTVYDRARHLRHRAEAHGLSIYLDAQPDTSARRSVGDADGHAQGECAGRSTACREQGGSDRMSTISAFPSIPRCRSELDFCAWLDQASPGERLEYHRGFLMADRIPHGRLSKGERQELVRIADRAMWAAEQGLVHLIQKRHRADDYSYFAVGRSQRRSARRSLDEVLNQLAPVE